MPSLSAVNAYRQRLLTEARVKGTKVLLDRWTLGPGPCRARTRLPRLAWFQLLEGEANLSSAAGSQTLTADHVAFLPPGFRGTLAVRNDATVLYAGVPDAARFDPRLAAQPPRFGITDWTREPVLDSEHDARKRIYVVTPAALRDEGDQGRDDPLPGGHRMPQHHHEGAEHFMYVLAGGALPGRTSSRFT